MAVGDAPVCSYAQARRIILARSYRHPRKVIAVVRLSREVRQRHGVWRDQQKVLMGGPPVLVDVARIHAFVVMVGWCATTVCSIAPSSWSASTAKKPRQQRL
jgi:hypothetical protein